MASLFGLLPFLQQGSADIFKEDPSEDIFVTGSPTTGAPTMEDDPSPRLLGNRSALEEAQAAAGNAPQRKGRFGVGGTLRDILGTLGDAFLVQSGNKAIYGPRRDQERQQDALTGFTQDPLAAAERMANAGGIDTAADLFNNTLTNQFRNNQLTKQTAALERSIAKDEASNMFNRIKFASAMMAAAKTPEERAAVRAYVNDPNGDVSGIPDNILAAAGINPYQQGQLPIAQQNADSRRIQATRPPTPRAPSNPTDSSLAAPLISKMGRVGWEGLTHNEQQQLRSLGRSPERGAGKGNRIKLDTPSSPAPPGWGKASVRRPQ